MSNFTKRNQKLKFWTIDLYHRFIITMSNLRASVDARKTRQMHKQTQLVIIKRPLNNDMDQTIAEVAQQQIKPQEPVKKNHEEYYKEFSAFLKIALILSISSLQVGYCLCQTSAVPVVTIINEFHLTMGVGLAHGLLLGIFPFGGIFGAMINSYLVRIWKKKSIFYFIGAVNLVGSGLMQITNMETIFIGRFLLGVTCGMYPMLAPVMTKELCPAEMRPLVGSFFSMGRIVGIVMAFALGVILDVTNVPHYWRIVFIVPLILGMVQTIMVFFFVPQVPGDLFQRGQDQQVRQIVQKLYHKEYVDIVIKQYRIDYELQKSKNAKIDKDKDPYAQNKKRAFFMAVHINVYMQIMGINTITLMSGTMMTTVQPGLALYSNLILNSTRLPPALFSTFYVGKKWGRRPLYLVSGVILAICNYLVAVGYIANSTGLIIFALYAYMFIFSLMVTPLNYAYPAEITPAPKVTIANIFNMSAMTISLLLPPIVIEAMNGDAYPVFLFFGIYITVSLIYMYNSLVESKGLKYQDIIKAF